MADETDGKGGTTTGAGASPAGASAKADAKDPKGGAGSAAVGPAASKGISTDDPAKATRKAEADAKVAGAQAKEGAASVAQEARRAASGVKAEATQAARDVAATARGEIQGALEEQKAAGAERAKRIAGAIDRAGDELGEEIPMVGEMMHRAAREIEHTATAVREREPGELVEVAQDFARRQPALFAGAVGLLGFAAVRFLKASPRAGGHAGGYDATAPRRLGAPPASALGSTGAASRGPAPTGMGSGDPGGVATQAPGLGLEDQG